MGGRVLGSVGYWDFRRLFVLFNTGEIGPWGTRIFLSGSRADNHLPYNNYGKIQKKQVNGRIWQPVGSNGDFISISGHYNQNRNNFFGSLPLRTDKTRVVGGVTVPRIVGPNANNRYPTSRGERFYDINYANPYARPVSSPDELDGQRARDEAGIRIKYTDKMLGDFHFRGFVDFWALPWDQGGIEGEILGKSTGYRAGTMNVMA